MTTIPHRFSEQSFRRYEPYIAKALTVWPEALTVTTAPFSTETFACRFRDAVRSVLDHRWATDIDLVKLQGTNFIVRQADGVVHIGGPRSKSGDFALQATTKAVLNPTDQVLNAICVCLANKIFEGPVYLVGVVEDKLQALETQYDVSYAPRDNGFILL